jgi:flagellar biosynthesis protein FlhB
MADNDGQERTEEATPKRQRDAREKGQIARSRELNTVMALLVAATAFLAMGDSLVRGMVGLLHHDFTIPRAMIFDDNAMTGALSSSILEALWLFLPFFILMILAALGASMALGGWSFSTQAMSFKWEKLDPVKGLGRVFAWRGVMEMFKGLAKFGLVAGVALLLLKLQGHQFLGLGGEPLQQALAHAGSLLGWAFLFLSSALLLVAAIDVPFQLWDYQRQIKMTRQEIKEEFKQTEGSPEIKGHQRRLQQEMAQRRMMEEVPKADVVVVNPTHFAVALRYQPTKMGAPIVVAKGSDLLAGRIRAVASENDVPVLSAPPLARAIYYSTELNMPIPEGLYRAVAQVLAYVYQLKRSPIYRREDMQELHDLPIPEDLRRDPPAEEKGDEE